jgi:O-antigen/teichoic acid export membrane protein
MNKPLSLIQRMGYSGINIYVEYLIGMASSILIARSMLPADYGSYTYFLWLVTLATSLVNAGISTGVIRFIADVRGKKEFEKINTVDAYLRRIQLFKIAILLGVVLGVYLWRPDFYLPSHFGWLFVFVPVIVYCKILHMYRISMLKGLESFKELALVPIIVSPVNFLVVLILYLSHMPLEGFFLAYFFTTLLYWGVTRYLVKGVTHSLGATEIDEQYKERIRRHLKVAGVSSILAFLVMSQSEIAFLKWFGYADAVAYFSIAHQLSGAAILLVPGVYSNILLPIIARTFAESREASAIKVKLSMVYLFQMCLLVGVPVIIFAPLLVNILYGEKYIPVAAVLAWLMSFSVIKGFSGSAMAYLTSADQQPVILKVTAIFVVITLGLDGILIWQFGLNGAIAAFGLSSVGMVIVINILAFRLLGQQPLWRQIGFTFFSALLSGAITKLMVMGLHVYAIDVFVILLGSLAYLIMYVVFLCYFGAIRHEEMIMLVRLVSRFKVVNNMVSPYLKYCIARHKEN